MKLKTVALLGLGAGLEYYDFVIYLLLAHFFAPVLFIKTPSVSAHTLALMVFGLGYLIRPLGAALLGRMADLKGRKPSICLVAWCIALSTLGIACIPSAHSIGLWAPVALLSLRLCQCIGFASELPCGLIWVAEQTNPRRRGLMCGFLVAHIGLGYAIAMGLCSWLSHHLSDAHMQTFGWRIPFVLGGCVALVAFYLRRGLTETPVFIKYQGAPVREPLTELWAYKDAVLCAMGLVCFPAALVTFDVSLPALLHLRGLYALPLVYHALFLGSLWTTALIPLFAWLGDCWGRKFIYALGCVFFVVTVPLAWVALDHGSSGSLYLFVFFLHTVTGILPAAYFVMLIACFKPEVRATAYTLSYNIVYSVLAFLPALLHVLSPRDFNLIAGLILGVLMAVSCVALVQYRRWA